MCQFSKGVRNFKETRFHHSRVITPVQELLGYRTNENSSCGNTEQDSVGEKKVIRTEKICRTDSQLLFLP